VKILIKKELYYSKEKYDRVTGLTDFVNLLFDNYFYQHEIPVEALESYYVDYYNQEVIHGGIAQFVYNSKWESEVVIHVFNGLRNIGAKKHAELFENLIHTVKELGERLNQFLESDYFQENIKEREILNQFNKKFFSVDEMEDLVECNWQYIGNFKNTEIVDSDTWTLRMEDIFKSLPDRAAREKEAERLAEENESEEEKKIEEILGKAGQELLFINGINPGERDGQIVYEWHVTTSTGDHYVIFQDDKVLLYDGDNHQIIYEMTPGLD
jgi:hypothetical protein